MLRFLSRTLAILFVAGIFIYISRALDSRDLPELGPEHRIRFESEFSASRESETNWSAYLRIEDALAAELESGILRDRPSGNPLDRYAPDSLTSPDRFDGNWNRSYELAAAEPVGVAVLLHGLTDSPYSLLSTAVTLAGAGYNVVVPRMPGHGYAVGGLRQARANDWMAAVRIAVTHATELPAADRSLIIAGYSNGGLLALDFALQCADMELRCPDKLVLVSPAISVSRYARVANFHAAISWIPYFEKYAWLSIFPEVDPFKFTSFPKSAGKEIREVSYRVLSRLADPARSSALPPILAFQSIVDSTVGSVAIKETLFDRLPANGSRLVVYDVNRHHAAASLMHGVPADAMESLAMNAPLAYDLVVLRNRNDMSLDAISVEMLAGTTESQEASTNSQWPRDTFSLSHIALPFRPGDAVYGDGRSRGEGGNRAVLGAMSPRGENSVLTLPPAYFLRARHNPFHQFQSAEMIRWLGRE